MRLETARLVLRPVALTDAEALCEMDADAEVRRWLDLPDATPLEKIHTWLESLGNLRERGPGMDFWAIEEKSSGQFLGWVHLKPFSISRVARLHPELAVGDDEWDIGWRLQRQSWGQGFATEAAQALTHKALEDWGASRLIAVALVGNTPSFRVMEKCGLRLEREFVYDNRLPAQKWSRVR
ncbi:MAG: GNAT family N-acetyltransferase [Armatimonas sp.]